MGPPTVGFLLFLEKEKGGGGGGGDARFYIFFLFRPKHERDFFFLIDNTTNGRLLVGVHVFEFTPQFIETTLVSFLGSVLPLYFLFFPIDHLLH